MPGEYFKAKGQGRGYKQKPFSGYHGSAFNKNGDKETKEDRLTKSMPLREGEMEGTWIPEGKQSNRELISDLEDRIEFMNEDVHSGIKTRAEANKTIAKLRKRIGYLRQNKTTKAK